MVKTVSHVQKNQKRLSNLYLDFLQFHWFTCSFISKSNLYNKMLVRQVYSHMKLLDQKKKRKG